ncbi:hypothetical protein BDZ97DRAFT_1927517 [Flammula alnicola]|nr:hypothetical protein BDZ97DRAFT_1927517 [Flammula alnicola]
MTYYASSIDDNDPSVIYSSGWELITSDGSWTGMMHSTSVPGSYARLRFTGSRIAVICTIPTGDGLESSIASFSVDNGPAVTASHKTTPPVQWNTVLWDSGPLPLANHLLIVTNTGNQMYLRIDRFDYDPTDGNAPPSSNVNSGAVTTISSTTIEASPATVTVVTNGPSPSSISSPPSTTSSASPSLLSNQTASSTSQSTSALAIVTSLSPASAGIPTSTHDASGANDSAASTTASPKSVNSSTKLIGGVLSGLLLLVMLAVAVAVLCLVRRRRRRAQRDIDPSSGIPPTPARSNQTRSTIPTPFDLNGPTALEMSASNMNLLMSDAYGHSPQDSESTGTSMYTAAGAQTPSTPAMSRTPSVHDSWASPQSTYPLDSLPGAPFSAKHVEYLTQLGSQQAPMNPRFVAAGHSSSQQDFHGGLAGAQHPFQGNDAPPAYQGPD